MRPLSAKPTRLVDERQVGVSAALSPEQQYYAKLRELRGEQPYLEWLQDTRITQQQRKELHALYTKCVRTLHKRMPVFGKYPGEK